MGERVKREDTRYKGVWDAGYAAGMAEANRVLAHAAEHDLRLASPAGPFGVDLIGVRVTHQERSMAVQVHRDFVLAGVQVAVQKVVAQ